MPRSDVADDLRGGSSLQPDLGHALGVVSAAVGGKSARPLRIAGLVCCGVDRVYYMCPCATRLGGWPAASYQL